MLFVDLGHRRTSVKTTYKTFAVYLYFLYFGFSACHHYPLTNSKLYLKCVVSGGDAWTDIIAIYSADVDFMQIDVKSIAPVFDISC